MRLLLRSVIRRLSGKGGDPVIQLKTAFGGGKTHAMLAAYHLAKGLTSTKDLCGVPNILDEAGVNELPKANVAVLDGHALGPAAPRKRDGITINTMWGELAWMLGGAEGYGMIAESDLSGSSPGKIALAEMFERYAPCVILMDETVAYLRQFEENKSYPGGTFDSNMSFMQALTEAANTTAPVTILASLPESLIELGGARGKFALESIEKIFGRLEAIWKPVATEESFEIVRRRLFSGIRNEQARDEVCSQFFALYANNASDFPPETREHSYFERLKDAYPIHPEVFDRLYNDWSTLERFQRTRGVLRLMALVIYRLWTDNNQDSMITPGSIPLYDPQISNELIRYLPAGWEPIVEREVDAPKAMPAVLDDKNTRLGAFQACRRVARTVFLGSAPSVASQTVRGIGEQNIRLGCAQAGQSPGIYDDALKRMSDQLHHLYTGKGRYWFDTRPNLRREMEERSQRVEQYRMFSELDARIKTALKPNTFTGTHVFTDNGDIPDDTELRLVVIEPIGPHRRDGRNTGAMAMARETLDKRGNQPRQYRNRLIFLACDEDMKPTLYDECRRYVAWGSILDDKDILNLDQSQIREATASRDNSEKKLIAIIRETYKWLLIPIQEIKPRGGLTDIIWQERHLSGSTMTLGQNIMNVLKDNEELISQWAPGHLVTTLNSWHWAQDGVNDITVRRLWEDFGRYNYLPRLQNAKTLQDCVNRGVQEGLFGLAISKESETYNHLKINEIVSCNPECLIVKPEVARQVIAEKQNHVIPGEGKQGDKGADPDSTATGGGAIADPPPPDPRQSPTMKRFYATVDLQPEKMSLEASNIANEIIALLKSKYHAEVKVTLEIEASDREGFDENTQRAVRENCNTLKFRNAEFEAD
jgi:predicted AAA+ superfamily ATPase